MKERKSYKGTLDGVFGIWTDKKPKGLKDVEEIVFYQADEGKVFVDKDGNRVDCVVIKDGVSIEDYTETELPQEEEKAE